MLTRLCIDMERLEYLPPVFPWVGLTEFNKFGNLLINWPFDMCSFLIQTVDVLLGFQLELRISAVCRFVYSQNVKAHCFLYLG